MCLQALSDRLFREIQPNIVQKNSFLGGIVGAQLAKDRDGTIKEGLKISVSFSRRGELCLTGGFLSLRNFSVAISVSLHVYLILVLILISMFLR